MTGQAILVIDRFLAAGFDAYLGKPLDVRELAGQLTAVEAGRRA